MTSEDIDGITNGIPSEGMDDECSCVGLHEILRSQGLTFNEFMTAADRAPGELLDFVQMTNTPRSQ